MKRVTLFLYNLLFLPLLLILLPGYLLRIWRRGGYRSKAAQRFGILNKETLARIGTGRIWIHAVSVGEVGIALKFISSFRERNPDARFLLSTTTSTGLAIVEKQASEWLEPLANPVDFPILTAKLVRKLRPAALLMVEADLWPNRVAACRALGIPTALLNARLSKRSEERFRRARLLTTPLFNQLDLITLTEEEDISRWSSLGVRSPILHWTGNIKYDPPSEKSTPQLPLPTELGWSNDDPLFLAASTHDGEEIEIARSFLTLRGEYPLLRLVIAPRHVERRASLVKAFQGLGLNAILRSHALLPSASNKQQATLSPPADLLLLDTTGELSLWYPLARVVIVGKSLPSSVNRGGQNMIEPLRTGRPVLIGPHTGNFEPLASRLCAAGAARRITDAASIVMALHELLPDPAKRREMILAAAKILSPHQGATLRTCELIEKLLLMDLTDSRQRDVLRM